MLSVHKLKQDPWVVTLYRKTYDNGMLHVVNTLQHVHWYIFLTNDKVKRFYHGQLNTLEDLAGFIDAFHVGSYNIQFCNQTDAKPKFLLLVCKPHTIFYPAVQRALTQELWLSVELTTVDAVETWKKSKA